MRWTIHPQATACTPEYGCNPCCNPQLALWNSERANGSASVQLVLILPALFSVMFLGMQGALFFHARTVALAAAQEGARAAGAEHGTEAEGASAATEFIRDAGGADVLTGVGVSATRGVATATVSVSGSSLSVIPGWSPTVWQTATMPVERLTQ